VSAPRGIVLLSCYELGHAPLGVAAPAAVLRRDGFAPRVLDLAVQRLDDLPDDVWSETGLVAVSVPMHTALRLATRALPRVRRQAPAATVAFFGVYAALNADHLLAHGVDAVIGGEAEGPLADLARALVDGRGPDGVPGVATASAAALPSRPRPAAIPPDRDGLPALDRYAAFERAGERRIAAAVESTRGCKHRCRHCPIPPVYDGRFFAVPVDVVQADVDALVARGVGHLTFADPDFLNGPTHALRVARAVHARHPHLSFDFTAKVEHVLAHAAILAELADCGAVFAVTAVESLNDEVLLRLAKGHTAAEAIAAVRALRGAGIAPRPSLMPFSPWETAATYGDLLRWIADDDLIDHVDPVHLSIRLLVPPGSPLASDPAMTPHLRGLDAERLQYRWEHPDPRMDRLHAAVDAVARDAAVGRPDPAATFARVRDAWAAACGDLPGPVPVAVPPRLDRAAPPRLTEPWFC